MMFGLVAVFAWAVVVVLGADECPDRDAREVVEIEYETLLSEKKVGLKEAFGDGGLGILAVTKVPESIDTKRRELMRMARALAKLPRDVLKKYEHAEFDYLVGWSHGREKFLGEVDTDKASWYANLYEDAAQQNATLMQKYPASTYEPRWPDAYIVNFSTTFRSLARDLYDLSYYILRHCDFDLQPPLVDVTHTLSRLHVARLLHYYPKKHDTEWCGWHNDNSVLTALAPAVYFDEAQNIEVDPPVGAGLVVRPRGQATLVRVVPPAEEPYILFQIGEAAQILSGGRLVATPHSVAPGDARGRPISRDAFALFVEPNWDYPLRPPAGVDLATVYGPPEIGDPLIPPLQSRLPRVPVDFAQFLSDSAREYYL